MYLSRVELNTERRDTMKALASLSKFHGAIEDSFEGGRGRRLWRIDALSGKKYILILSESAPDLENFAKQYGYAGRYETKDYSSLLDRIQIGGKWRFRLTANPTVCKEGKILAHITDEHQKKWLSERAEKHGFVISDNEFTTVCSKWYDFYKNGSNARVKLLSVTFEGVLAVTDTVKFKETLCTGIGREKAYGQGLLTVIGV